MRKDTAIGIGFAHLITWSIIITTPGSLHDHGIINIQSAKQVAKSLEPLVKSFPYSGFVSKSIFVIGIIGTGFLSIPILSGSTAYTLSDTFNWRQGFGKKIQSIKSILSSYHSQRYNRFLPEFFGHKSNKRSSLCLDNQWSCIVSYSFSKYENS